MKLRPSFMWGILIASAMLLLQVAVVIALLATGTPARHIAEGLSLAMRLIPALLPLTVPIVIFAGFWGLIAIAILEIGRSLASRRVPPADDRGPRNS